MQETVRRKTEAKGRERERGGGAGGEKQEEVDNEKEAVKETRRGKNREKRN